MQDFDRLPPKDAPYAPLALVAMHAELDAIALAALAESIQTKPYLRSSLARLVLVGAPAPQARELVLESLVSKNRDAKAAAWSMVGALAGQGVDMAAAVPRLADALAVRRDPTFCKQVLFAVRHLVERGVDMGNAPDGLQKAKGPPKDGYQMLACQLAVTLRTRLWPPKVGVLHSLAPELVGMLNNDDVWETIAGLTGEAHLRAVLKACGT